MKVDEKIKKSLIVAMISVETKEKMVQIAKEKSISFDDLLRLFLSEGIERAEEIFEEIC